MKKILFFGLLLFFNLQSEAQGINFEADVNAAFAKAKLNNKMVMIECYHPQCPICMALEPTLKEKEVGNYYNQFYVSYKLNLSDQNQVKFLTDKKLYLPSFPMMLFFDTEKKLIHNVEPQNSINALIDVGQKARLGTNSTAAYLKKYQSGEKSIDILVGLGQRSRITMDTVLNKKSMADLYEIYPKENLNSEESWLITQKCVTDFKNGFATYWFDHISEAAVYSAKGGHADTEKNALSAIIQASLFSPEAKKFTIEDVQLIQKYMGIVGAGDYIDTNTWQATIYACENDKTPSIAKNMLEIIMKKFEANPQALIYIAKFITDETKTLDFLDDSKIALYNASQLIPEKDYAIKAEYNYEYARMSKKENNGLVAQKFADLAFKNAQLAKLDTKKYVELIKVVK
jgi:thioredoxin-related protein